jgi:hypothetical protein
MKELIASQKCHAINGQIEPPALGRKMRSSGVVARAVQTSLAARVSAQQVLILCRPAR